MFGNETTKWCISLPVSACQAVLLHIFINIDGKHPEIPAAANTLGKTVADQLVAAQRSWKTYQESLPLSGANPVNNSDGFYTSSTDFSQIFPTLNPPLSQSDLVPLYAVKHSPFVYFSSVQEGRNSRNSLKT